MTKWSNILIDNKAVQLVCFTLDTGWPLVFLSNVEQKRVAESLKYSHNRGPANSQVVRAAAEQGPFFIQTTFAPLLYKVNSEKYGVMINKPLPALLS